MADVEIYTVDGCSHCANAKETLKRNNISFTEVSVPDNAEKSAKIFEQIGMMTVPVICKKDRCIIGNNEDEIKTLKD